MAMQDFSPEMYEEFCQYIRSVRGFEIEQFEGKVIGSFSDPTQPGVMNMNVTFPGRCSAVGPILLHLVWA